MARPVWSGSISFGLVNVPVKAFTAVRSHDVHFHQLEKGTGARIRNQKISEKTGKPVDGDDIEMGFEVRKGRHVTFDNGELADLKPESTKAVEVSDFVALEDIDPIYYERTYWLAPADQQSAEPYRLLLAAMEERSRVGIGSVVPTSTACPPAGPRGPTPRRWSWPSRSSSRSPPTGSPSATTTPSPRS
jgi:DNA end-binding protein Ku